MNYQTHFTEITQDANKVSFLKKIKVLIRHMVLRYDKNNIGRKEGLTLVIGSRMTQEDPKMQLLLALQKEP